MKQATEWQREYQRKKRQTQDNRLRLNKIKLDSGCVDCGYKLHPEALDFDHLPEFEKSQSVSWMLGKQKSWTKISQEVLKCEVVCSNCHRVRTFNRRNDDGA